MEQKKKRLQKTLFILVGIILFIVAFCFYLKWKLPIERTNYETYEEYDIFMEYIKDEICTEWGGIHPMWSNEWMPYCTYPYTEEEREEMTYLQENFMNMDYEEILSMSRHKYGFAYGYGASVVDYIEFEYQGDRFPTYECLNEVMDDSLENYTILEYNPQGVGSSTSEVILNEESRRFVIFCFATIR